MHQSSPFTSSAFTVRDRQFMQQALDQARHAAAAGEVPVGALVVIDDQVWGAGWNAPILRSDPTCHAEIVALRQAAARLGNYRLVDATLYSTLEPCVMCAGALVVARLKRVVFAARDLRFGGVRSKFELADSALLNHRVAVEEGLLAPEASELLLEFFRRSRTSGKPLPDSSGSSSGP